MKNRHISRDTLMKGVAVDSAPRGYSFERCVNRLNQRFPRIALSWILVAALCLLLTACGTDEQKTASSETETNLAVSSETADPMADQSRDPIERLAGIFYIDGDTSAARVVVNGDGRFVAYYASGTEEQRGYVSYERDDSTGSLNVYVYVFYTDEGKPYMGFVDTGENRISEFETGNGSFRYVRVD